MEPLPRFWAHRNRVVDLPDHEDRPDWDLTVWGSSNLSQADAERDADERLAALIAAGGPGRMDRLWYYPDRRLPEAVVREIHDGDELIGVITRNRYGAEVLNTDALFITDVDLPEPQRERPVRDQRGTSLLGRLLGRGRSADSGTAPEPEPAPLMDEAAELQRIDAVARSRPDLGFSVYRTRAGLRVLVTGAATAPDSADARELMEAMGSDGLYVLLCRVQRTYRARLTPKPWRLGIEAMQSGQQWQTPGVPQHEEWAGRYRAASAGHAVCRLIGRTGAAPSAREQLLIDAHDEATGTATGLPLA